MRQVNQQFTRAVFIVIAVLVITVMVLSMVPIGVR